MDIEIWEMVVVVARPGSAATSSYLLRLGMKRRQNFNPEWLPCFLCDLVLHINLPCLLKKAQNWPLCILPSLNTTLTTSTKTSGLKMGILFGSSYGTFMIFFGLAQLPASSADFTGHRRRRVGLCARACDQLDRQAPPAPRPTCRCVSCSATAAQGCRSRGCRRSRCLGGRRRRYRGRCSWRRWA